MTAISPNRLQNAAHYCTAYAVVLPNDHSLDDAMKPDYWAHVSLKLRQHDTIRVIPEDGSYFAELLVIAAQRGFAKVRLLQHVPLDDDGETLPEGESVYVKWAGPHLKHVVIRRSDGERLKEGLSEKTTAEQWARDYLASLDR